MRREDPFVSTASDGARIAGRDVGERARQLPAEAELDDALVRVELGVATDEVVQPLCNTECRPEQPRKCGEQTSYGARDVRNDSRHSFRASHRRICEATQPLADLVEEQHGQAEPLGERECNRVGPEVVAELVCHDSDDLFFVECRDRERTDDEYVASARESVQVVAVFDREQESSPRSPRRGKNHPYRNGKSALFVAVRSAYAEEPHDEESLCDRNEHDNGCENGDGDEHGVGDVERKRHDEPDQRDRHQPGGEQRRDGKHRRERSRVDGSFLSSRHATEARHHRVYTE